MGETPAWGTPEPAQPDLFSLAELVIRERNGGFFSDGYYEVLTPTDVLLGTVAQDRGSGRWPFGGPATFVLADAGERPIATMVRPTTWGRPLFEVTAADGSPVGSLEQENIFMGPRLALRAADGRAARLVGGGFGSGGVRMLTDGDDRPLGQVSQEFGWGAFFAGTDVYVVRLGPELTGSLRLLAILAVACVDLILNAAENQRRNSNPQL